ncbi:MAG TPA: GGDEF domain-containing protein [Candidatus Portnoybacteria bacterium]|jgi:diguanylate cyclase (GGDEF)-like protein|nr:GGDEF domain-containing protein [Candidatus Portnoybacteria bacterium]MDD5752267.1 GGDEF domain-containing protein [Candidatus Portnoybacteria bacterium]HPJ80404.1 GGDEF domain-containing protein [Candidatus Portnoybacteria bacterium]
MNNKIEVLKKENQKLKKQIKQLKNLATIDFLTKIYNRRAFTDALKKACKEIRWVAKHQTRRQHIESFVLLLADIDDFKKINDQLGYLQGDKILKQVAKFLKQSVRDFDIVARWGGEEFAIILKEITLQQAKKKTETIMENVRKKLPITLSMGVVASSPKYSEIQIFKLVDEAVHKAKNRGKNQIVVVN